VDLAGLVRIDTTHLTGKAVLQPEQIEQGPRQKKNKIKKGHVQLCIKTWGRHCMGIYLVNPVMFAVGFVPMYFLLCDTASKE
jgi:hypothetical protein